MALIQLQEALHLMNDRETPFSIQFVSYDEKKKEGGKLIQIDDAIRVGAKYNLTEKNMIAVRSRKNSNHPYPVHIRLITAFNGLTVHL